MNEQLVDQWRQISGAILLEIKEARSWAEVLQLTEILNHARNLRDADNNWTPPVE